MLLDNLVNSCDCYCSTVPLIKVLDYNMNRQGASISERVNTWTLSMRAGHGDKCRNLCYAVGLLLLAASIAAVLTLLTLIYLKTESGAAPKL